jgi:hypothetical protein
MQFLLRIENVLGLMGAVFTLNPRFDTTTLTHGVPERLPPHSRASRLVEHGDEPRAVQQNTLVEIEERRKQ